MLERMMSVDWCGLFIVQVIQITPTRLQRCTNFMKISVALGINFLTAKESLLQQE